MADFIHNIALGRDVELYNRVQVNDPGTAVLSIRILNTTAADLTLKRLETLAAIIADPNTAEVTNGNYAPKILTDADLVAIAPDHVNDWMQITFPDQTWTSVAAGDAWTDAVISYDGLGTAVLANMVPMSHHDFPFTPNGGDITLNVPATGFFRAQ